jgi:type VI secretion system protein VasG
MEQRMTNLRRQALFERLNPLCYETLQSATAFCKMRGHAYVEMLHWLYQLLDRADSDILRMLQLANADLSRLMHDLNRSLDRLPRGATAISDFAVHVDEAVKEGWVVANVGFDDEKIRSGHVLIACMSNALLRNALLTASAEFARLSADGANTVFLQIRDASPETLAMDDTSPPTRAGPAKADTALGRFATDLTARARSGQIDPVIGRDAEVRMIIDVLMRRRQNNPILTGDAGVGKTAVVEGLACAIVSGNVPPAWRDVEIHVLDLGLLQAGAGAKGDFEDRLRQVIEEVQAPERQVILFIDEVHSLVGAGGNEGTGDAANLLKPALARGTLRTVGATTWSEYKRYIERDPALTRRFQPIAVNEPPEEQAITMIRGMASVLERHHGVEVTDDAVVAAVRLSHRYIPARQLPDKAISLLDTCCSRVSIGRHSPPAELAVLRQTIGSRELELEALERMAADGEDVGGRRSDANDHLAGLRRTEQELTGRWQVELSLVEEIRTARAERRGKTVDGTAATSMSGDHLRALLQRFSDLTGETRLVSERVTPDVVGRIVQEWTGIPLGQLLKNEAASLLSLAETLGHRVIGQDHAMEAITRRIQTSRAGLDDPNRPSGVFLLCGPSGVGKTETAHALAEHLQGGPAGLITINMSEFQEAHTVSLLKGAPPGYVGYGQGGRLTEAVRRRPNAVVLLDEIEKAHPDVHELFYQVFDKGLMEDGEGRLIDFRNTLILMTSNLGSGEIVNLVGKRPVLPAPDELELAVRRPLADVFAPAFLGRMIVLPYYPLSDHMLSNIIRIQFKRIADRLMQAHGVPFTCSDAVIWSIIERVRQSESGGRGVESVLTHTVLPAISRQIFTEQLAGRSFGAVHLDLENGEFHFDFQSSSSTESTFQPANQLSVA